MAKKKNLLVEKPQVTIGRPTKYEPSMCARVIELGKQGLSKVQIAADLGISKDTFCSWVNEIPAFSDAVKTSMTFSEEWWSKQAMNGLWEVEGKPKLNATLWYMNMKNRFGWADKQEHKFEVVKQLESVPTDKLIDMYKGEDSDETP